MTIDECEDCGEAIAFKRLLARPVTTLCIDCKEEREREEQATEQAGRAGGFADLGGVATSRSRRRPRSESEAVRRRASALPRPATAPHLLASRFLLYASSAGAASTDGR